MAQVWQLVIPLALVIVLMMLMTRPARKRQQAMQDLQSKLAVGDHVMTNAGIYGTIRAVAEEKVEVEVASGVVMTFHRQAIGRRTDEDGAADSKATPDIEPDGQPPVDPQSGMESE